MNWHKFAATAFLLYNATRTYFYTYPRSEGQIWMGGKLIEMRDELNGRRSDYNEL